jgi:hypothetical protein
MLVINKKITNHNPESNGPVVRSIVSLLFGLREGVTCDLESTNPEGKRDEDDRKRILHSWAQAVLDYSRTERMDRTEYWETEKCELERGENCLVPSYLVQYLYPRNEAVYMAKIL